MERRGVHFSLAAGLETEYSANTNGCGRSSGVEHNLAKVRVESSNIFARSNITGPHGDMTGPYRRPIGVLFLRGQGFASRADALLPPLLQ